MSQEYADSVDLVPGNVVQYLALSVMFAALTGILAQLSVPIPGIPVPFSFQPFGVFFAALVLGPVWGGFAMLLYVIVGVAGAPVFSNLTAGLGVLFGPTGGFLVGFIVAAFVGGILAHRSLEPRPITELRVPTAGLAMLVALVPMYVIAVPWWMTVADLSLGEVLATAAPFAATDVVKAAIAVAIVTSSDIVLDQV